MTTHSKKLLYLILFASVAGWGQTNTPTPTYTPTFTPTKTPVFGGQAGLFDADANKEAMDRARHLFSRGWGVIEPNETRAYEGRSVFDSLGNSKIDLVNFLTNTSFASDTTGWSVTGSCAKAFDASETDIDNDGGSGGSMELTYTGGGTAYFNLGINFESAGFYTFGVAVKSTVARTIELEMDLSTATNTSTKSRQTSGVSTDWQVLTITKWVTAGQQIDNVGITMSTAGVINVDNVGLYRSPVWPGYIPEGVLAGGATSFTDITLSGDITMGDDILWDADTKIMYDSVSEEIAYHLETGTFFGDIAILNGAGLGYAITPVPTQNQYVLGIDGEWYAQNGLLVIRSNSATGDKWSSWESDPAKTMTPIPAPASDYGLHVDNDTHLYEDIGLAINSTNKWMPVSTYGPQINISNNGPEAFGGGQAAAVFGLAGSIFATAASSGSMNVTQNMLNNGTNDVYMEDDEASVYVQDEGTHRFKTAATGTAGNTITWVDSIYIENDGDVGFGTTSPANDIHLETSSNALQGMLIDNDSSGSSAYASIKLGNNTDDNGSLTRNSSANTAYGGANSLNLITVSAHPITIATNNGVDVTVEGDGDVDINEDLNVDGTTNLVGTVTTGAANIYDVYAQPELTALNETIDPTGRRFVLITDDQTVATLEINSGNDGQMLTIIYNDTSGGSTLQIDDNGYMEGLWEPNTPGDSITFVYITALIEWVELDRKNN